MVFYPDNVPRRDRALELQTDISLFQTKAKEQKAAVDKQDERILPYIDAVLQKEGLQTAEELRLRLESLLTEDQKKSLNKLYETATKVPHTTNTTLKTIGIIVMTAGVVSSAIDFSLLLEAVNLSVIFRGISQGFMTLATEGIEAGIAVFKSLSTTLKLAGEGLEQASVTARYAANASRFLKTLAIVGIFTDAFVFAFDAYEEHQQTVGLENAVKQLYTSRIVAKVFSRSCDVIQSLSGLLLSFLITIGGDLHNRNGDAILKAFVDQVKKDMDEITSKNSLDLLIVLDAHRGSWTHVDPSYDDSLKDAEDYLNTSAPM